MGNRRAGAWLLAAGILGVTLVGGVASVAFADEPPADQTTIETDNGGTIQISAISVTRDITPNKVTYTVSYSGPKTIDYVIDDPETGCLIRFLNLKGNRTEICVV